jgi:hypothetical protein
VIYERMMNMKIWRKIRTNEVLNDLKQAINLSIEREIESNKLNNFEIPSFFLFLHRKIAFGFT